MRVSHLLRSFLLCMAARVVPLDDGSRTMVSDVAKFLNTMASACQVVTNDSDSLLTAIRRFHHSHNLQRTSPQELAATMHTWYGSNTSRHVQLYINAWCSPEYTALVSTVKEPCPVNEILSC